MRKILGRGKHGWSSRLADEVHRLTSSQQAKSRLPWHPVSMTHSERTALAKRSAPCLHPQAASVLN